MKGGGCLCCFDRYIIIHTSVSLTDVLYLPDTIASNIPSIIIEICRCFCHSILNINVSKRNKLKLYFECFDEVKLSFQIIVILWYQVTLYRHAALLAIMTLHPTSIMALNFFVLCSSILSAPLFTPL